MNNPSMKDPNVKNSQQNYSPEGDSQHNFDVVVVGGGMIGVAAALGLVQAGFTVALVESKPVSDAELTEYSDEDEPSLRISALSCRSVNLLKKLGAWLPDDRMRATPYRQLETWEYEAWAIRFDAASLGMPELGVMLENSVVQAAIWQQLAVLNLAVYAPDRLERMTATPDGYCLTLGSQQRLSARLVIGADGADSKVRQFANIGVTGWDYRQACLSMIVQTDNLPSDTTWQQFFPTGPRAFLPLYGRYASLAWYDHQSRIQQLATMPIEQLTAEVMKAFPTRLGEVKVLKTGAFPLTRRHAQAYVRDSVVLIGDAAHTINPLAGQGANLGYRDLEELLSVLIEARDKGERWWSVQSLLPYQRNRRADNFLMQTGMDFFYTAFSHPSLVARIARNAMLIAAERAGIVKKQVLKYALGF